MKKIITFLFVFNLFLLSIHASEVISIQIEQVVVNAPNGRVIIRGTDLNNQIVNLDEIEESDITLTFDNHKLNVESFQALQEDEVNYYIFIDSSASMDKNFVASVQETILNWKLNVNQSLNIYSFDEEVTLLYSSQDTTLKLEEALQQLKPDGEYTCLFDAVQKYIDLVHRNQEPAKRNVAIVFSDGANYYTGGLTKNEIMKKFENEGLPVFAIMPNSNIKGIEDLSEVVRCTNGKSLISEDTNINNEFEELMRYLENAYEITFKLPTNKMDLQSHHLLLEINNEQLKLNDEALFKIRSFSVDDVLPQIIDVKVNKMEVALTFNRVITNIDELGCYRVFTDEKDIAIDSVVKKSDTEVVLKLSTNLSANKYSLLIQGLIDNSMEAHELNTSYEFEIGISTVPIIAGIGVLLIIGVGIVIMLRKNHKYRVEIGIIDPSGIKTVKTIITKENIFIGRDSISDITIMDEQISKKHGKFTILNKKIYYEDLESLNGSLYNGEKVFGRVEISNGDVIEIAHYYIEIKLN